MAGGNVRLVVEHFFVQRLHQLYDFRIGFGFPTWVVAIDFHGSSSDFQDRSDGKRELLPLSVYAAASQTVNAKLPVSNDHTRQVVGGLYQTFNAGAHSFDATNNAK